MLCARAVSAQAPAHDPHVFGPQPVYGVPASVGDTLAAEAARDLVIETVVDGLDLVTAVAPLPDGSLLIGEKGGRLVVFGRDRKLREAGRLDVDTFGARGLLNFIEAPDFATTRRIIAYYSARATKDDDKQRVSSFVLRRDGTLQIDSERVLVRGLIGAQGFEQGGGLAIGTDAKLYIGVGDGGCRANQLAEPPYTPTNYFATCLSNPNGKILRVDLDGGIPEDNPLVNLATVTACGGRCGDAPFVLPGAAPRKDIWIWGVRNPWRLWVDPATGHLWFVDVGDISYEEVNVVPLGGGGTHYGWPWREGPAGHARGTCQRAVPERGECREPAYACAHGPATDRADGGCQSMGGGLGIDDCRWPEAYRGRYYFGDCSNGFLWSAQFTADRGGIVEHSRRDLGRVGGLITDMDLAADGGLYVGVLEMPPGKSRVVRILPRHPRGRCPTPAGRPRSAPAPAGSRARGPIGAPERR